MIDHNFTYNMIKQQQDYQNDATVFITAKRSPTEIYVKYELKL